jgi:hypothetical protein
MFDSGRQQTGTEEMGPPGVCSVLMVLGTDEAFVATCRGCPRGQGAMLALSAFCRPAWDPRDSIIAAPGSLTLAVAVWPQQRWTAGAWSLSLHAAPDIAGSMTFMH